MNNNARKGIPEIFQTTQNNTLTVLIADPIECVCLCWIPIFKIIKPFQKITRKLFIYIFISNPIKDFFNR